MKTYHSFSSEETKKLGHEIARKSKPLKGVATVIALEGDLGAGKTTFVQGFFEGLGLKKRAVSPTFVIMRRHALRGAKRAQGGAKKLAVSAEFSNVFHIDAYRMRKAEDLAPLELETIFREPRNIVLIEWPEQARSILPKGTMRLRFAYGKKENERKILF